MLKGVVAQRWSSERDLSDTLERYAVESVIAQAEAGDRADRVEDELFRFERIVAADAALRTALADARPPADKRTALVRRCCEGKVAPRDADARPPGRRRSARPSLRLRRREYLETASRRREQQTATVISAVPLGEQERARLAAGLSAIYGGKVHVNTVVDPRVLGGIKVEIGDEVIDGTVIRKLDAARRAMGA